MNPLPVVVGYHAKRNAREALFWAAREASLRGTHLVVLFAANYPGMTLPRETGSSLLEFEPGALDAAREVTARGVAEVGDAYPGLDVWGRTAVTSPAQALIEASAEAELLVVGSRGLGAVLGALLGSVSFVVAARAECPVVVVKPDPPAPVVGPAHRVVVGTDGSPQASAAVTFAAGFAAARSASLEIVCCTGEISVPALRERAGRSADAILDEARAAVETTHPGLAVGTRREDGAPEPVLVDASGDAGLVVVGTRGRGTFKGAVAGSVTFAVIQGARCPVAVVGKGDV